MLVTLALYSINQLDIQDFTMRLGIVIPCYNEQEVLSETSSRLLTLLGNLIDTNKVSPDSQICFVDDGSIDNTWNVIASLVSEDKHIAGIKLSRNCGHQNALLAGLFTAHGDAIISIDADLQDDISVIEEMVDQYISGVDIVFGVRKRRDTDTRFKRWTGETFYRTMALLGVDLVFNHADYRLLSRRAVEALKEFREVNLFLRGMVPLIGFPSCNVYYDRAERFAGESTYPLKKMIALALDGITSFSVVPLRFITVIGVIVFLLTLAMIAYTVLIKFYSGSVVPGWASTVLPVYLLGGIQIFCIGIIGEYLGKIYKETKARPRYIMEKVINL